MRTGVTVHLSPTDRKRLQAIVDDRNSLQKHVWRARIVLWTADGLGTAAIMRTAGVSKTAVWRCQARFMEEGLKIRRVYQFHHSGAPAPIAGPRAFANSRGDGLAMRQCAAGRFGFRACKSTPANVSDNQSQLIRRWTPIPCTT